MMRHRKTCRSHLIADAKREIEDDKNREIESLQSKVDELNKTIHIIQSADTDSLHKEIHNLNEKLSDKDEQLKVAHNRLAEKDEEIKKLTSALVAEPKVVNNNNYFDINVKTIDEVSLKHITEFDKIKALRLDIVDSIPAIVEKIYWGDEPRNACIKIPNKRCREWVVQRRVDGEKRACHVDKDEVIDIAMGHSREVLLQHASKNESNLRNLRFLDHNDEITKSWNSDKKLFKEQRKRTEMKVLDHCTTK
eukprot:3318999-Prymnesium_polylepis.1